MGNTITSNQNQSYIEDGSNVNLSCSYSTTYSSATLQWYRQYPRSAPQFLVLMLHSTGQPQRSEVDPRLMVKLNKEKTQVFLQISSVQVSDSALYYCALTPTVTQHQRLPYKNLTVTECEEIQDGERGRHTESRFRCIVDGIYHCSTIKYWKTLKETANSSCLFSTILLSPLVIVKRPLKNNKPLKCDSAFICT